jgi:hypothetical protein
MSQNSKAGIPLIDPLSMRAVGLSNSAKKSLRSNKTMQMIKLTDR